MGKKRQQQIYFRSLALPPASQLLNNIGENENQKSVTEYCPHFLAALQLIAHVMVPLRKALVHFYVSYRNKDVQKLEWLTLLAFGRLFRDLITTHNSGASSVMSGNSSVDNTAGAEANLPAVSTERFFPALYSCLVKHELEKQPKDATEALHVLLDCLNACTKTVPVTNQLWSALLDKACLGLIVSQSLVGRQKQTKDDQKEVLQRSMKEQVIMWCPHVLNIGDISRIKLPPPPNKVDEEGESEAPIPNLQQLIEEEFKKRPLSTTSRAYYNFDKKHYDFEVEIPTKFLDKSSSNESSSNPDENWITTRTMQLASLTGYLFLGIDRKQKSDDQNGTAGPKIDRSELEIPSTLNLTKLLKKSGNHTPTLPSTAVYELVGGALYDEGEYIAVLKDDHEVIVAEERRASTIIQNGLENIVDPSNGSITDDDDEEETWKLMESEETIGMSESDVLEFLKGEGNNDDEGSDNDEEEDFGPCGTLAVYKLKIPPSNTKQTIFDEMNQLLSDIVIAQVSGKMSRTSQTDFYIEEEVYEEEIIED